MGEIRGEMATSDNNAKDEAHDAHLRYSVVSSVLCGFAFVFGIVVKQAPSFEATYSVNTTSCDIEASLHVLRSCQGSATSIWDFCTTDHSTCHNDSCQDLQDTFCNLHGVSFVFYYLALVGFFIALIIGCTYCCIWPKEKSHLATLFMSRTLMVSSFFYLLVLPIWGAAKGELPDLNANNQWMYLPGDTPKAHEWDISWGFALAFMVAASAPAAAGCAQLGYNRLVENMPAEELVEVGVETSASGEVHLHLDEPESVAEQATGANLEAAGVPSYPPSAPVQGDGMKPLNAPATPMAEARVEVKTTE